MKVVLNTLKGLLDFCKWLKILKLIFPIEKSKFQTSCCLIYVKGKYKKEEDLLAEPSHTWHNCNIVRWDSQLMLRF